MAKRKSLSGYVSSEDTPTKKSKNNKSIVKSPDNEMSSSHKLNKSFNNTPKKKLFVDSPNKSLWSDDDTGIKSEKEVVDSSDDYMNNHVMNIIGMMESEMIVNEETPMNLNNNMKNKKENPIVNYTKDELKEFVSLVRQNLDEKESSHSFRLALSRFKWDQISFKDLAPEQCKALWLSVQEQIRTFKTFEELTEDAMSWLENGVSTLSKKKIGPKKVVINRFNIFQKERIADFKQQNPTEKVNIIVLNQAIAKEYKTLSREELSRLDQIAKEKIIEHKKDLELYNQHHHDELITSSISKKGIIKLSKPQKAKSPFEMYLDDYINESKIEKNDTIKEKMKKKWNNLEEDKMVPYIARAKEEYVKKCKEIDQFNESKPESAKISKIRNFSPKENQLYLQSIGYPQKPPQSGYNLFIHEQQQNNPELKSKTGFVQLGLMWKQLTKAEQDIYNERRNEMKQSYESKILKFESKLTPKQKSIFDMYEFVPSPDFTELLNTVPSIETPSKNGMKQKLLSDYFPSPSSNDKKVTDICEADETILAEDEFPRSASAYFRQKENKKKKDWKKLSEEEKQKWEQKYEKKKRKHEKRLQIKEVN